MSVLATRAIDPASVPSARDGNDPSQIYYSTKARHMGKTHPPAAAEQLNPSPEARATAALEMMFGYFG